MESAYPMIQVDDAISLVVSAARAIASSVPTESVPLTSALNRYASTVYVSPFPHPPFSASIMDGYAVLQRDFASAPSPGRFSVQQKILAGPTPSSFAASSSSSSAPPLPPCVYVATGAPIPTPYDLVIPVEYSTTHSPGVVSLDGSYAIPANKNVRPPGCDFLAGELLCSPGQHVTPAVVGLLAASGYSTVSVYKKAVVGVLSTGDELLDLSSSSSGGAAGEGGAPPPPGCVYDSNRPLLLCTVSDLGGEPLDLGLVNDSRADLKACVERALGTCDVLLSSGGASAGEADHVKPVLEELGFKVHFGRMEMKPGKPTAFATRVDPKTGKTVLYFALPGNPSSAAVCSLLLLGPCLRVLSSGGGVKSSAASTAEISASARLPSVAAVTTAELKLDKERPEYHRAVVQVPSYSSAAGAQLLTATSTGEQRSSRLTSFVGSGGEPANALLLLPKGNKPLPKGSVVEAFLLRPPLPPPEARPSPEAHVLFVLPEEDVKHPSPVSLLASASSVVRRSFPKITPLPSSPAYGASSAHSFASSHLSSLSVPSLLLVVYVSFPLCSSTVASSLLPLISRPAPALARGLQSAGCRADALFAARPLEAGATEGGHLLVVMGAGYDEIEGGALEAAVGAMRELVGRPLGQMRGDWA